ncbi:MAG: Flp family type IVb pilin [Deltaproteobacteria bacterium]|nr:Flp family type IVb pilin [Deltaproteobacteria bacterium]
MERIKRFIHADSGVTAMEYAMILGLLAAAILAGIGLFYGNMATLFNAWATWFTSPSTKAPVGS